MVILASPALCRIGRIAGNTRQPATTLPSNAIRQMTDQLDGYD
ncbi:hypothetical protein [Kibdelosporangium philippinense]